MSVFHWFSKFGLDVLLGIDRNAIKKELNLLIQYI